MLITTEDTRSNGRTLYSRRGAGTQLNRPENLHSADSLWTSQDEQLSVQSVIIERGPL